MAAGLSISGLGLLLALWGAGASRAAAPPEKDPHEALLVETEAWTKGFAAFLKKAERHWPDPPKTETEEVRRLRRERQGFMDRCLARSIGAFSLPRMSATHNYHVCVALSRRQIDPAACSRFAGAEERKPVREVLERNCRALHRSASWIAAAASSSGEGRAWCERSRPAEAPREAWISVCRMIESGAPAAQVCAAAVPLVTDPGEKDFPRECPLWVAQIRGGEGVDCAAARPEEVELCRFSQLYPRARKSGDRKLCAENHYCRALVGEGEKACRGYLVGFREEVNRPDCQRQFTELDGRLQSALGRQEAELAAEETRRLQTLFKDDAAATLVQLRGEALSEELLGRAEELSRVVGGREKPPGRRALIMDIVALRRLALTNRYAELERRAASRSRPREVQDRVSAMRKRLEEAAEGFRRATEP